MAENRAFECVQGCIQSVLQGQGLGPGKGRGLGLGSEPMSTSGSGSKPGSGLGYGLGDVERALVLVLSHKALVGGFCGTLGDCVIMQVRVSCRTRISGVG